MKIPPFLSKPRGFGARKVENILDAPFYSKCRYLSRLQEDQVHVAGALVAHLVFTRVRPSVGAAFRVAELELVQLVPSWTQ